MSSSNSGRPPSTACKSTAQVTTKRKMWQAKCEDTPCVAVVPKRKLQTARKELAKLGWAWTGAGSITPLEGLSQMSKAGQFETVAPGEKGGDQASYALFLNPSGSKGVARLISEEQGSDQSVSALAGLSPRLMKGVRRFESEPTPATSTVEGHATFTFVELFAGIGGFRVALEALGGRCTLASEVDPEARKVYAANFGGSGTHFAGDVYSVDGAAYKEQHGDDLTLLVGGFPCQSFSTAGEQRGFGDDNGRLFFELVRLVDTMRPKAFLLENVANLAVMEDGRVWETVRTSLSECGYDVMSRVIDSSCLVPQNRERIYIVGFRRPDINTSKPSPAEAFQWPALGASDEKDGDVKGGILRDILEPDDSPAVAAAQLTDHQWHKVKTSPSFINSDRGRMVRIDGKARTVRGNYKNGFMVQSEFVPYPLPTATDADGIKLEDDAPPPRFFTPREVARLQGFPEDFVIDVGRNPNRFYHQAGNAVTVPVVRLVASHILQALGIEPAVASPFKKEAGCSKR